MARASNRDDILAAGRDLIHRQGFNATGIADITAAAEVPKGSFYNHFPSKEAFGIAALEDYWEHARPVMEMLAGPPPAAQHLRGHFQALAEKFSGEGCAAGCMLGNFATEAAGASEAIRARTAQMFAEWTAALAQAIRNGLADGSITTTLPADTLARFLVSAWQGAVQRTKVDRDDRAYAAFFSMLDDLLNA